MSEHVELSGSRAPEARSPVDGVGRRPSGAQHKGRRNPLQSFARLGVAVPAAAITFALCLFMGRLIEAEFIEPPASEVRELAAITPQIEDTDPDRTPRLTIKPITAADPPPPPPELTVSKSDIGMPTPVIQGEAPTELVFDRMGPLVFDPVIIDETDARPISPPVAEFPLRMAERGIEGRCEVRFNVNARGEPVDLGADCTHSGFVRAAQQAVSRVRFAPKIVRGQPVERRKLVYPLEFRFDGG